MSSISNIYSWLRSSNTSSESSPLTSSLEEEKNSVSDSSMTESPRPPVNLRASAPEETSWINQWVIKSYNQWFVDSKRPEKGQKYVLSLARCLEVLKEIQIQEPISKQSSDWDGYYFSSTLNYFFSSSTFDQAASAALWALKHPDQYTNIRLQYADFLSNARTALACQEYINLESRSKLNQHLVHLIEDLCYYKFSDTHLFNYQAAFLDQLCGPVSTHLDFGTLSEQLNTDNKKLKDSPDELRKECIILNYEKLQGTIGASFDPVGRSNVPKRRSQQTILSKSKQWTMSRLAHGTPTKEENLATKTWRYVWGAYNAEIIPEYKAFLRAAQRRGEKVFYVNLQKTKDWLESDRSFIIDALQDDPEFTETFYCMSIPMDGSKFKYLIEDDVSTEDFKRSLMQLFFTLDHQLVEGGPVKLPRDLQRRISENPQLASLISKDISTIIHQVHTLYFEKQELKSLEDRQDFIMQFYSDLTDYMISLEYQKRELQESDRIRFVVQACKDNKDRGGAKNGIDEAKYILLTYPLNDPKALHEALYELYVNTLGAYIIKFEEILPDRLVYFTSLLQRYAKLAQDPDKIKKIRANQPSYFKVEQHHSAKAFDLSPVSSVPTPKTAFNLTDYLTALEASPTTSIQWPLKQAEFSSLSISHLVKQLQNLSEKPLSWVVNEIQIGGAKDLLSFALNLSSQEEIHQWIPHNEQEKKTVKFLNTIVNMICDNPILTYLTPPYDYLTPRLGLDSEIEIDLDKETCKLSQQIEMIDKEGIAHQKILGILETENNHVSILLKTSLS